MITPSSNFTNFFLLALTISFLENVPEEDIRREKLHPFLSRISKKPS